MENAPVLPTLNGPAPDFSQASTHGQIQLADYKGRWLVLFSHPADFTPVCTTEMIGFAKRAADFDALNCDLLGLSIDSVFSHIAWVRNMEETHGTRIPFPILADLDMSVARAFGMVHPGASESSTVRCVFVIDPEQIIRAMIYYPMTNGRSIEEVLRLVRSLQTSDEHACATPEGWVPGEKVVVPPPKTQQDAEKRMEESGLDRSSWYLSLRDL